MFPNLLGQKAFHHLSNEDMGKIIGVTRAGFEKKIQSGRFSVEECRTYFRIFNKSFEFLFALDTEVS